MNVVKSHLVCVKIVKIMTPPRRCGPWNKRNIWLLEQTGGKNPYRKIYLDMKKKEWNDLHWVMFGLMLIVIGCIILIIGVITSSTAEASVTVTATVPLTIHNAVQCLPPMCLM